MAPGPPGSCKLQPCICRATRLGSGRLACKARQAETKHLGYRVRTITAAPLLPVLDLIPTAQVAIEQVCESKPAPSCQLGGRRGPLGLVGVRLPSCSLVAAEKVHQTLPPGTCLRRWATMVDDQLRADELAHLAP